MQKDLKVTKVYVQDDKQEYFDITRVDGSIVKKVHKSQMLDPLKYNHCFINADIKNDGDVQIFDDIPVEQLKPVDLSINAVSLDSTNAEKLAVFDVVKSYAVSKGIYFHANTSIDTYCSMRCLKYLPSFDYCVSDFFPCIFIFSDEFINKSKEEYMFRNKCLGLDFTIRDVVKKFGDVYKFASSKGISMHYCYIDNSCTLHCIDPDIVKDSAKKVVKCCPF